SLFAWDGTHARAVATLGYDADIDEILRQPHPPIPAMVDLMSGQRVFHRVYEQDRAIEGPHPFGPRFLAGSRIRTNLIIPLRKDEAVLGFISANRREVHPYSDKEISLLENFAAQAVIAMENARLLGELRESLEQQTAMADVLGLINGSTGDITPVFDAMVDKAMTLCDASFGVLFSYDGQFLRGVSTRQTPHDPEGLLLGPIPVTPEMKIGRALREGKAAQTPDLTQSDGYRRRIPLTVFSVEQVGIRTVLYVPLVSERGAIGLFAIYRLEVRPFTDKQIALVQSFAAQAVVAMEDARLLSELRETLE